MKKESIVIKIMDSIRSYLTAKYGKVNEEWELTLLLLQDNIEMYLECKKAVKRTGIFDDENYRKNPLLSTMKDIQATVIKEIQHLGLSPYSSTKIGNLADAAEDSDLLKNLMALDED